MAPSNKLQILSAVFTPAKASEASESEAESKRSLSKSPVKRTKGKTKNPKVKTKSTPPKNASTVIEERKCPVEGCDSMGHLSGLHDKHFTQESCPTYHNVAPSQTKVWSTERKQRSDDRRKATILYDPMKKVTTVEQKAYQLKIQDIRTKFKPNPTSPTRLQISLEMDKEREPDLNGLVSEYDLQLFREAQAIASDKIENDLKKLPPERGTK